ncbi:MAG: hypothetical protein QOD06_104, partial [Candidatus Binatota bacterium]|nr:hypothetical protein [Candidatus Binatota bacterium]
MRPRTAAIVLAPLLALLAGASAAEEFQDARRGIAFDVPAGWREIPDATLGELSAVAAKKAGIRTPQYVAGFARGAGPGLAYPYVLVQDHPIRHAGLDQLAKAFTGLDRVEAVEKISRSDLVQKTRLGTPVLDPDRKAVMIPLTFEIKEVGKVQGLTALFPLRDSVLQLNFYAVEPQYERDLADFAVMLDSVHEIGSGAPPGRLRMGSVFLLVAVLVMLAATALLAWR